MRWCRLCTLPEINPLASSFDETGVCAGCRSAALKMTIDWDERRRFFEELVAEYRSPDGYDCIVPVSGGKDSYFAAHIAGEFGLKALLVTYHSNNYLPEGEENLGRMKELFDADHVIVHPSDRVLRKLHRLAFRIHGDMNWHNHCGIYTLPMQMAVKFRIPLVLWGDHGFTEQGGMFSHHDFFEYTAKDRLEHSLHGYDWDDFIEPTEGLTPKDLRWAMYPSDEEILDVGVRGIFLSNYFYYDGNLHAQLAKERYGWTEVQAPFDRTYRRISNVDDRYENGVHDYMKWIKFGYGRTTDHTCYDIRLGLMTRAEAVELIRKYDHVRPSDLAHWLEYAGITEEEFDSVADTFRNPRVWRKEGGTWTKENIWGAA